MGQRRETTNFEGQDVKGQGHTRLKMGLETWWRHLSYPSTPLLTCSQWSLWYFKKVFQKVVPLKLFDDD